MSQSFKYLYESTIESANLNKLHHYNFCSCLQCDYWYTMTNKLMKLALTTIFLARSLAVYCSLNQGVFVDVVVISLLRVFSISEINARKVIFLH